MLMTACSSNNTPKTQYYLLNSPTLTKASESENKNTNKPVMNTEITNLGDQYER